MKLQFKVQQYQTEAVDAVVDVFSGQPYADGVRYRMDPGRAAPQTLQAAVEEGAGLRNAEIVLTPQQLLECSRDPETPWTFAVEDSCVVPRCVDKPRRRDGDRYRQDVRLH